MDITPFLVIAKCPCFLPTYDDHIRHVLHVDPSCKRSYSLLLCSWTLCCPVLPCPCRFDPFRFVLLLVVLLFGVGLPWYLPAPTKWRGDTISEAAAQSIDNLRRNRKDRLWMGRMGWWPTVVYICTWRDMTHSNAVEPSRVVIFLTVSLLLYLGCAWQFSVVYVFDVIYFLLHTPSAGCPLLLFQDCLRSRAYDYVSSDRKFLIETCHILQNKTNLLCQAAGIHPFCRNLDNVGFISQSISWMVKHGRVSLGQPYSCI